MAATLSLLAAPQGWTWAFYDTAAHVEAVLDSLDGRGAVCGGGEGSGGGDGGGGEGAGSGEGGEGEGAVATDKGALAEAELKQRLRELLPIISADMADDEAAGPEGARRGESSGRRHRSACGSR